MSHYQKQFNFEINSCAVPVDQAFVCYILFTTSDLCNSFSVCIVHSYEKTPI
jgi:hypothetical protein